MKLIELRKNLKDDFTKNNINAIDVDFIIAEVLGVSHMDLVLIDTINTDDYMMIMDCVKKRLNGMPIDKIFNKAYFYKREFIIDQNVLSPRQDSEILIDVAIKCIKDNDYKTCLDLCTGSGCLAVTLKCETGINIDATDISAKALKIAKQNAKKHNADINFIRSNMFEKIDGIYDLIISNPPYISTDEIENLDREVRENDPIIALDGGDFGLKYYNIIHNNLRKHLNPNGMCILEIGDDQRDLIESLFTDFTFIECVQDFGKNDRVLVFKK